MILLTVDEIIGIHEKLVEASGGSSGLRDEGLLKSAVYSAEVSFDDVEMYPTVEEKAARLAYSLINNHAFVDGNKRIGVFVMFCFSSKPPQVIIDALREIGVTVNWL